MFRIYTNINKKLKAFDRFFILFYKFRI